MPDFQCPGTHPYLLDQNLSEGRSVPAGVRVTESGRVAVNIAPTYTRTWADEPRRLLKTGWIFDSSPFTFASATNWNPDGATLTVEATCTSDASRGAPY
ncbi:hypothetical protein [Microbacterium rhizomatis]|uniref:hypothetical protein n=1 Tax=Microbacterium rhizomatis TaxID=1631477 RepID=UPI00123DC4B7|nr:hypothetical protein [Microbacterium rhizomatis]